MSQPPAPALSDLIFPQASKTLTTTLTSLKRTNLSISNRLQSIKHDADFVQRVAAAYQLPLVANERCGSWYIRPTDKRGGVYFKSTDGHFGQWSLNLRRLNLHLLEVTGSHGGCIIVDSTRRGKSMPDALSKTIPIWAATLNRHLFPEREQCHALKTPDSVISSSEHAQINDRLASFVRDLDKLALDVVNLRSRLNDRPLEVVWATPDSQSPFPAPTTSDSHLLVLCTASGRTSSVRSDSSYVQGAADDSESWACGLTAATFWAHQELLLAATEDELPDLIWGLTSSIGVHRPADAPVSIQSTNVSLSDNVTMERSMLNFDIVVSCSEKSSDTVASTLQSRYVHLPCVAGKAGGRQLRERLPKIRTLQTMLSPNSTILVSCDSGRDLAVGVALTIICLYSSLDAGVPERLDKDIIKQRLSWIMMSRPDAAPSRATLQSVNAFLLGPP
ncbi:tRNA a64-2'-o-ribosylphosphate transferase [Neohortaea acidophila]|uniref:tRNA a64-2'-o-ribosylphosphate transferase n=1 Tax=Neohortaea acidophila TaxID=245834 RepID=A0A6A6PXP3_9PEZI|nr:tRNA a64-2'-o-ribosylphosphate transferase [Neohortaea acidophila]KAF2484504.1 tRNA a64-2'-o-ribosylphosphate transferase [Neohortaea acidophila]